MVKFLQKKSLFGDKGMKALNRGCIYCIYDKDGIIEDYIIHQLNALKENVNFIHCVVNGALTKQGKESLEKIADEVYVRENAGIEAGTYKDAIVCIGWEKLRKFDEVIFMNDACFGPVYSFKEIFAWSENQDVDLWGLTWCKTPCYPNAEKNIHYTKKTYHIQSYFVVYRKSLLESTVLENFFNEIPSDCQYNQINLFFKYSIPGYFEDRGYKSAVYCSPVDDFEDPLLYNPVRLLKKFRMPLIKKQSFSLYYTNAIYHTAGEATSDLLYFLQTETDYDMDLIWKSILRTESLSDIVRCTQLKRILPKFYNFSSNFKLKVGVVFHAYYEDLFDENISYLKNFPNNTDILITTTSKEKVALLEKKLINNSVTAKIRLIKNRGRDNSALLVGAKDFVKKYDLICFAHDKKTSHLKPASAGYSWAKKLNENMFGSKEYVLNVINLFEEEKLLGMAFPPYPNHSNLGNGLRNAWGKNFNITKELLKQFDANVQMSPHTLCVAPIGGSFWFRPKALNKLFTGKNWCYEDFPEEGNIPVDGTLLHALEHSYAYFAQDAGFYPATIYTDKYASIDLTNLELLKTDSRFMRFWMNELDLNAQGLKNLEKDYREPIEQITDKEVIWKYLKSHGIRDNVEMYREAVKDTHPLFWKLIWSTRKIAKFILRV